MTQLLKKTLVYQEKFVPGQWQALTVLTNLLQAELLREYVLYESGEEVRIAGNALAQVVVTPLTVSRDFQGLVDEEAAEDPFKQVETLLAELPIADWTAYGYVTFDMASFYSAYSKAIEQPLLYFLVPEIELRITTEGVLIRSIQAPETVEAALSRECTPVEYVANPPVLDHQDRETYQNQVGALTAAIREGRLQKAIISRSVQVPGELDVLGTYQLGAKVNNAVRSYCFKAGEVSAVGFSPEILMQVEADGFVFTNPLAGTRHRDENPEEDARLYAELFTDAKEVKEHALSIWLAQSEIASVCLAGSVQIYDFMEVKRYRCVQHLSSRVGGQLSPDKTLWDALKVLFPGITVSGIDKPMALEWIDRLEQEPRGIYAGALGWVNSAGMADLAIAIRSVYQYGDRVHLNAGAGIVAESVPEREYMESVYKMNTMLTQVVINS